MKNQQDKTRPTRRHLEVAAVVVASAVVVVMTVSALQWRDWMSPGGRPAFGDFIAFWGAGRAAAQGDIALVHDARELLDIQRHALPDLNLLFPWNSPPTFLLLMLPLSELSYPASAILFLSVSFLVYIIAAAKLLPDRRSLLFAASVPAVLYHLNNAQTGVLVAGISGLALYWLDRRPAVSGLLISLLAIKPHLAILWPLFLLSSRKWNAFIYATIATSMMCCIACAAFGTQSFQAFLANIPSAQSRVNDQVVSPAVLASIYCALRSIGSGHNVAIVIHTIAAALAVALSIFIFLDRSAGEEKGAALCATSVLLPTYLFFYDLPLLMISVALLGFPRSRLEIFAWALAWGAGLSVAIGHLLPPPPLGSVAAWLILLSALARVRFRRGAASVGEHGTGVVAG